MNNLSQIMQAVGANYSSTMDLNAQANAIADKVARTHETITLPKPELKLNEFKLYRKGYVPVYIPDPSGSGYLTYASSKVTADNHFTVNNAISHTHLITAVAWLYNCWYDGFSAMKNYRENSVTGAPLITPHSVFKQVFTEGTAETKTFPLRCGVYNASGITLSIYYDGSTSYYFKGFNVVNTNNKTMCPTGYNSSMYFPVAINIGSCNTIQLNKTSDCIYLFFDSSFSIPETITAPSANGSNSFQLQYRQAFSRYTCWQPASGTFWTTMLGRAAQSAVNRSMSDWWDTYANVTDYADDIITLNTAMGSQSNVDYERIIVKKNYYMMRYKNYNGNNASFDMQMFPCISFEDYYYQYGY